MIKLEDIKPKQKLRIPFLTGKYPGHILTMEEVRVMAVADGYAMLRRPGCTPFVRYLKDIMRDGELIR